MLVVLVPSPTLSSSMLSLSLNLHYRWLRCLVIWKARHHISKEEAQQQQHHDQSQHQEGGFTAAADRAIVDLQHINSRNNHQDIDEKAEARRRREIGPQGLKGFDYNRLLKINCHL